MRSVLKFLLLLFACIFLCTDLYGNSANDSAKDLDQAIQEVISQREYQWRLPREAVDEEQQGLLYEFFEGIARLANRMWKPIADIYNKFSRWLRKKLSPPFGSDQKGWNQGELDFLIVSLIALLALLLLLFVWRYRKRRRKATEIAVAEAIMPVPDLEDENLIANQLPVEGWTRIAQQMLAKGDLRLALRAFFMATLAHLAETRWITVAKYKSNREYWLELSRRASDRPEMKDAFHQNVSVMDRVWYGLYPVTQGALDQFLQNAEIVKRSAA